MPRNPKADKPVATRSQPKRYYDDFECLQLLQESQSYNHFCELLYGPDYGPNWENAPNRLGKQTIYIRRRKLKEKYNITTEMLPNWGRSTSQYKATDQQRLRQLFPDIGRE